MSKPVRNRHASLDRPRLARTGELPAGAELYRPLTPWQATMQAVARHPGDWFQLDRAYANIHSAIQLARRTADESGLDSKALQFASAPDGDKVTVYLRFRPEPAPAPEPEADADWRKLEQQLFEPLEGEGAVEGESAPDPLPDPLPEPALEGVR